MLTIVPPRGTRDHEKKSTVEPALRIVTVALARSPPASDSMSRILGEIICFFVFFFFYEFGYNEFLIFEKQPKKQSSGVQTGYRLCFFVLGGRGRKEEARSDNCSCYGHAAWAVHKEQRHSLVPSWRKAKKTFFYASPLTSITGPEQGRSDDICP